MMPHPPSDASVILMFLVQDSVMLRYTETPDKVVVFFTESTFHNESQIQEAGDGFLELCGLATSVGKRLLLDLRDVQFMSTAMLGKLVLLNKLVKRNKLVFQMVNVERTIMEKFRLTRLNKVFWIVDVDDDPDLLATSVPLH
jgi:anti-sigma B factor antagonist